MQLSIIYCTQLRLYNEHVMLLIRLIHEINFNMHNNVNYLNSFDNHVYCCYSYYIIKFQKAMSWLCSDDRNRIFIVIYIRFEIQKRYISLKIYHRSAIISVDVFMHNICHDQKGNFMSTCAIPVACVDISVITGELSLFAF